MSVARTARRRRKQFSQGNNHLAKLGRPIYKGLTRSKAHQKLVIAELRPLAKRGGKA